MENYKKLIGEVLGALIAVVWIAWALITPGHWLGLVIALDLTIFLGALSGGFIAMSTDKIDFKEAIVWVLGASIGIAWITWALLYPGDMVGLVIALAITIVFGTICGGLVSQKMKKNK